MTEVPATPTPLNRDNTAARFLNAYQDAFGELPDRNRAELLLAMVWLENANGQSIIQHNWGNLSTVPSAGGDFWRPPWFDLDQVQAMEDGAKKSRLLNVHQRMLDGKAPEAFRAFESHELGARAWLKLLQQERMRPILDAASSGDATRFAHAIFSTGYCPDPECKAAGPSYAKLRDQINAASYFDNLKKKVHRAAAGEHLGLWFWCWGQLLSARTTLGSHAGGASLRTGEP